MHTNYSSGGDHLANSSPLADYPNAKYCQPPNKIQMHRIHKGWEPCHQQPLSSDVSRRGQVMALRKIVKTVAHWTVASPYLIRAKHGTP